VDRKQEKKLWVPAFRPKEKTNLLTFLKVARLQTERSRGREGGRGIVACVWGKTCFFSHWEERGEEPNSPVCKGRKKEKGGQDVGGADKEKTLGVAEGDAQGPVPRKTPETCSRRGSSLFSSEKHAWRKLVTMGRGEPLVFNLRKKKKTCSSTCSEKKGERGVGGEKGIGKKRKTAALESPFGTKRTFKQVPGGLRSSNKKGKRKDPPDRLVWPSRRERAQSN